MNTCSALHIHTHTHTHTACPSLLYTTTPSQTAMFKDVLSEERLLSQLSHLNLPYNLGICSKKAPCRIVVQFEGIYSSNDSY